MKKEKAIRESLIQGFEDKATEYKADLEALQKKSDDLAAELKKTQDDLKNSQDSL